MLLKEGAVPIPIGGYNYPNFEISFRNGFFNKFSYFIEIGGVSFLTVIKNLSN